LTVGVDLATPIAGGITVISDTSPIRCLAHLGHLDLLPALFAETLVPEAVVRELENPTARLPPLAGVYLPFVHVRSPVDRSKVREFLRTLQEGESEALALALEVGASSILVDDAAAKAEAKRVGLVPVGVIGLLLRAKQRSMIPVVLPLVDRLRDEIGFYISTNFRANVAQLANEPLAQ
jgi:predicted nucleic acid-binding protein